MFKIEITFVNDQYFVNGQSVENLGPEETIFVNRFILANRPTIEKILYIPAKDVEILK